MNGEQKRKATEEYLERIEEGEVLFADGFDDAIVGIGEQFTNGPVVVYDWDKCVEVLVGRDGVEWVEAVEHMDFNVTGAWVGEKTPIFFATGGEPVAFFC